MVTVTGLAGVQLSEHPMKGPMSTQSLRGLRNMAPFHWRGDRINIQAFNPAFDKLMGGAAIPSPDMDAFATFLDSVIYPPNPNQNLDRTYATTPVGASAEEGRVLFTTVPFRSGFRCVDCHSLFTGSNNIIIPNAILQEPQHFKVAQLRNVYKRLGRRTSGNLSTSGYGLLHDGTLDDTFELLSLPVFGPLSTNAINKTKLQAFVESFDTGLAPIIGRSVTVDQQNHKSVPVVDSIKLLLAQAHPR